MAATVNARDVLIMGGTRTETVTLPSDINISGTVTGNVTGTLNGVPVQTVIDSATGGGGGDVTKDILENSSTSILMTSSQLFKTGSGAGGVFIGSGGLFGKNSVGDTKFSISATTGLLTAENATINGTLTAGSIITGSVTVDGVTLSTINSNASTGASHASLTGNVHNVGLGQITGDLDDIANGSTYFKTTSTQVTGAGRAYNALDANNEYIKSLTSTKLSVVGANPSTGWVGDANGIRMYQGGALKVNIPVSGSPSFSGDVTSSGDIKGEGLNPITGAFYFAGSVYNLDYSVYGRGASPTASGRVRCGVVGEAEASSALYNVGVYGKSTFSNGYGVVGYGTAAGVLGQAGSSVSPGVLARGFGSGPGLSVIGPMTISSSALVTNLRAQTCVTADSASTATLWNSASWDTVNGGSGHTATFNGSRPSGGSATNTWWRVRLGGVQYWIPIWVA